MHNIIQLGGREAENKEHRKRYITKDKRTNLKQQQKLPWIDCHLRDSVRKRGGLILPIM